MHRADPVVDELDGGVVFGKVVAATVASVLLAVMVGCGEKESSRTETRSDEERYAAAVQRFQSGTFIIRYAGTTTIEDESATSELTIYQRRRDAQRVDLEQTFDDGSRLSLIFIDTPSDSAFCIEELGAFAFLLPFRDRSCLDIEALGDEARDLLDSGAYDSLLEQTDIEVTSRDEKVFAGEQSECFAVVDESDSSTYELCFGESGALLSLSTSGDETSLLTATSVSNKVEDSVFQLPYPLVENFSLEIRNNTTTSIFVNAYSVGSEDFIDGRTNIAAGSAGTLQAGLRGDPFHVEFGTYEDPQWYWVCTWDDAKANEPLIVSDKSANCSDISLN